jgi:hypothetical protein
MHMHDRRGMLDAMNQQFLNAFVGHDVRDIPVPKFFYDYQCQV